MAIDMYTSTCRGVRMWVGGYDLHLIGLVLVFFMLFMIFFNGLIDVWENSLPLVLVEAFRPGEID